MPLDHVGLTVPKDKYKEVLDFYLAALAPLGYKLLAQPVPHAVGLGKDHPDWWIAGADVPGPQGSVHVAFSTLNRADVDKFHEAALAAGGKDNGAPGVRTHYHPNYYGAFVFDPVGTNIEVVCHCSNAA